MMYIDLDLSRVRPIKYRAAENVNLLCCSCFFKAMTQIRRRLLHQMYRNVRLKKAVAFSLFVKARVTSSTVNNWSVNKLHVLTGVSASAIRQRLSVLRELGLIEEIGKDRKHLVFKSLKSHTSHRNAIVPDIDFTENTNLKKNVYAQKIKQLEDVLSTMLVIEIQNQKNYAKQMIQQSKHPKNLTELKDAKKACKHFGYGEKFSENGISYKYIADKLGVSLQKAFEVVNFAVKKQILCKYRNIEKRFLSNIDYIKDMILNNYTYIKKSIIYKVYANTYELAAGSPSARFAGMV